MNVQAQVTDLIAQMRECASKRELDRYDEASDQLETLTRACLEPDLVQAEWADGGFTGQESRAMGILYARMGKVVSFQSLVEAIYFDRIDGGPVTALDGLGVLIYKIRRKLKALDIGLEVENKNRVGFRLVSV